MESKFDGIWVCEKNENFDQFLKELGAGMMMRGMAKTITTTMDIKFSNGKFLIKTTNGPKTKEVEFALGQEISDDMPGSSEVAKGSWCLENDKMVGKFSGKAGKQLTIERAIVDNKLVQKMKVGNTECTRTFGKK